jgi:ornithine cyclodeaminase/alanine dehydrogenase-like protein (mu-crystallin family)
MERVLARFSAGQEYQHPRVTVQPPGGNGMILLMPAAAADTVGLKILSMFPKSVERGLPGVQGMVIILDAVYGELLAIIDGTAVTEIRTAAVTAIATARLAPADARILGVIGAGVQARGHLLALGSLRPWEAILLYSRTAERADALAKWAREQDLPVQTVTSARDAVRDADVICTVTSSCEPVFDGSDVTKADVHVNAIGAFGPHCRELPLDLTARATIVVDSREAALREAGDIMALSTEGLDAGDKITAELGEVVAGTKAGRSGPGQITVFKSLGLPIEDIAACEIIYRRAVESGLGEEISFP